jgi:UDP-N-acetylglucosamine acyltransferase
MAKPVGINVEGLKRRQFSSDQIKNIKAAYKLIYRSSLPIEQAQQRLLELEQDNGEINCLIDFLNTQQGGIIR